MSARRYSSLQTSVVRFQLCANPVTGFDGGPRFERARLVAPFRPRPMRRFAVIKPIDRETARHAGVAEYLDRMLELVADRTHEIRALFATINEDPQDAVGASYRDRHGQAGAHLVATIASVDKDDAVSGVDRGEEPTERGGL